jgi:hypothetical protein
MHAILPKPPFGSRRLKGGAALICLILALGQTPSDSVRAVDAVDEERHFTGLPIVGPEVNQIAPRDEAQARAVSAALDFALGNPDDAAYPWVDDTGEVIILSAASDRGLDELEQLAPNLLVPHEVRRVQRSLASLDQIAYEVTQLEVSGIEGGETILRTEPDWKNNRIIVTVRAQHDVLFEQLAIRFGTQALAIRVSPDEPVLTRDDTRQTDVTPFTGGANLVAPGGCSDAFSWKNSVHWEGMLTAGHCAPNVGVSVKTMSNMTIGEVAYENWDPGVGTRWFAGEQVFRGDISLVRARDDRHTTAWIFRGGVNSTAGDPVMGGLNRWVMVDDPYCVSAAQTGDVCGGLEVDAIGVNEHYGDGEWALNMVRGSKFHIGGLCTQGGDSGGAVFKSDGGSGVLAMGIHSGGAAIGPSCITLFTDIRHAIDALPGTIKWNP